MNNFERRRRSVCRVCVALIMNVPPTVFIRPLRSLLSITSLAAGSLIPTPIVLVAVFYKSSTNIFTQQPFMYSSVSDTSTSEIMHRKKTAKLAMAATPKTRPDSP